MPRFQRLDRLLPRLALGLGLGLTFALAACGGGSDATDPAVAPPVVVAAKATAAFSAPSSAAANQAVVFDAGASTSSDGSALSYAWDFGDGQHGGGKTIARTFGTGGPRSVTLTVVDGAGLRDAQTKVVTIAAPASSGTLTVNGRVTGLDGVALDGVAVTQAALGGAAPVASTDATGKVTLSLPGNVALALKLSKPGFSDQFVPLSFPAATGADAYFEASMRPRDAALALADAAAGGVLTGRDGATITLPPGALVNGAGVAATGPVQISMTPVDVTAAAAGGFPGSFDGIKPDGVTTPIVSFGAVEFVLESGGSRLQLAPGKTATIEVPIYAVKRPDGTTLAVGDATPLWSLDETTGAWIQEGTGTVVASATSPSGLAMRATVSHFSWWNSDLGFDPYGPSPRCVYDTDSGNPGGLDTFATATVCNLLAEIDRGLGGAQSSRARPLAARAAAPLPPAIAGYRRGATVPMSGGTRLPVPANLNVAINAAMLNGTWIGRTVVNGPVGVEEEVLVKLHQIAGTGPLPEAIAVPLDATRSLQTGQIARFTFTGAAAQYARITVNDGAGSNLTGQVRLLQGATALGSAAFGPGQGQIVAALPADGSYTVELTGLTNTPGTYRLQVELLGGLQTEALAFPFDVTRTVAAFTSFRGSFSVASPTTLYAAFGGRSFTTMTMRIAGPGGTVLTSTSAGNAVQQAVVPLPAAGTWTVDVTVQGGVGGTFSVSAEPTPWLPVSTALDVPDGFSTVDLVADRNGKPVVGTMGNVVVNQQNQMRFQLRRWNGSAWESAATDFFVDSPCQSTPKAAIAFDAANNPVVAYASFVGGNTKTTVRRFVSGAWADVGPNGGVLPVASAFSSACSNPPALVIDAADRPLVAYRTGGSVTVQRFDGAAWLGLATAGGDAFATIQGGFDLRLDPADQPYLAVSSGGVLTVQRFNAAPGGGWEAVGPNGGQLPNVNSNGFDVPKLRFTAIARPVVASIASVPAPGIPGVFSQGVAVHRFDGAAWSSTGGFQDGPNSYVINTPTLGFEVSDGDAIVAWKRATLNAGVDPVVLRNTATGWTPIGSGAGSIPQYSEHGMTPDVGALDSRLLQIGGELYLTTIVSSQGANGFFSWTLVLLRKV